MKPDPAALRELYQLVAALPDDLGAWYYINGKGNTVPVPAVVRFWERVGLTAYEGARSCWPDRQAFLEWACDPHGSFVGPHGPPSRYGAMLSCLRPRQIVETPRAPRPAKPDPRGEL